MKIISLIKAAFSQDMNLFKYSSKKNSSKAKKIIIPIFLFFIVCIAVGGYAFELAEKLAPYKMTYIMLSVFMIFVTIITFFEGIYKSQGLLFDAKDNDLLFSLPIKKWQILFIRILKLLVFQYIYNLMFLLPAFIVYIVYEKPRIIFYFVSILMSFFIPIIPTVISCVIGYVVKLVSSKFKSKKIMQTVLSSFVFLGAFYLSMNFEKIIGNVAEKATSLNDMITKLYYPIGLYIRMITKFEVIDLIKLFTINLIPLFIFILIGAKFYFKIILNAKEMSTKKKINNNKEFVVQRKPIISLIRKEIKRYFSSPVYIFNTSFGLLLALVGSILLCIKGKDVFDAVLARYDIHTSLDLSTLFYIFVLFVGSMTSISSSSISLEGKTINITKSLPIGENTILKSKILTCFVIELPFILLSDLIFMIKFTPHLVYVFLILGLSFIIILFSACVGLIVNLKYPKMNANNDTEVVKQSMSSMISVFTGIGVLIASIGGIFWLSNMLKIEYVLLMHLCLMSVVSIILYKILMKNGAIEYKKINA